MGMTPEIITEIVIHPHDCLHKNCAFIGTVIVEGETYFGCMRGVFTNQISIKRYKNIQAGILLNGKRLKGGFGAVPVSDISKAVHTCKLRTDVIMEYSDSEMEVIECTV